MCLCVPAGHLIKMSRCCSNERSAFWSSFKQLMTERASRDKNPAEDEEPKLMTPLQWFAWQAAKSASPAVHSPHPPTRPVVLPALGRGKLRQSALPLHRSPVLFDILVKGPLLLLSWRVRRASLLFPGGLSNTEMSPAHERDQAPRCSQAFVAAPPAFSSSGSSSPVISSPGPEARLTLACPMLNPLQANGAELPLLSQLSPAE